MIPAKIQRLKCEALAGMIQQLRQTRDLLIEGKVDTSSTDNLIWKIQEQHTFMFRTYLNLVTMEGGSNE